MQPPKTSAALISAQRELETLKNELLDQIDQIGHLAEHLAVAYRQYVPDAEESAEDADLRADVGRAPEAAQALGQFARETLHDYDSNGSSGEVQETQCQVRHEIRNWLAPVDAVSQEVIAFKAEAESPLLTTASELQQACESAKLLLDFLTGKRGSDAPSVGASQFTDIATTAGEVEPSKILVADDNASSAKQLRRHLARQGHSVLVVHNGRQAIDALQQHLDVDLVLLDVIMPELDGISVLQWIKAHEQLQHVPVIMGFRSRGRHSYRQLHCRRRGGLSFEARQRVPARRAGWFVFATAAGRETSTPSSISPANSRTSWPAAVKICCEHRMRMFRFCSATFVGSAPSVNVLGRQRQLSGSDPL